MTTPIKNSIAVILGAGKPFGGDTPAALRATLHRVPALQWCLQAMAPVASNVHFVGGYEVDRIHEQFPQLHYCVNLDWQVTGPTASLFQAPLEHDCPHYVCYSDIVFGVDTIRELAKAEADIAMAVDGTFFQRPHSVRFGRPETLEKARVRDTLVETLGNALPIEEANALFIGLIRLSPRAVDAVRALRDKNGSEPLTWTISTLVNYLAAQGLTMRALDIGARWATFDEPQDVARFVLGTKAETLEKLKPVIRKSRILGQITISRNDWLADQGRQIASILHTFDSHPLIVRSSTRLEDSWASSNAGRFQSVSRVKPDASSIRHAIETVIASFPQDGEDHQVLVQPMLDDVRVSGVVLTRTLRHGAPYHVVNYDLTAGRTDGVTSGREAELRTYVSHHGRSTDAGVPTELGALLPAVRELESLVGHDSLDIEFAIRSDGHIFIFQLRPIVGDCREWQSNDRQSEHILLQAEEWLARHQTPARGQAGRGPAFGTMPDWNPAEIIGVRPRRLALSLYQHLITNDVWARQRSEAGYRDLRPCALITAIAGHPYVDIRASFNSFIPASLPQALGDRLVDCYLSRLRADPELHDKIEFEIALTCLTFSFERRARYLAGAGFTHSELLELSEALKGVTANGISRVDEHFTALKMLVGRREAAASISDPLERARILLDDAKNFGTLPFAHLARQGFVATELLRSAVSEGLIPASERDAFMRSLRTVASAFTDDSRLFIQKALSRDEFANRYGHLRPGTYEITSPCYGSAPWLQGDPAGLPQPQEPFTWSASAREGLSAALEKTGLPIDFAEFESFLRTAIEGREWSKFEFTRNLSAAIESIAEFGIQQNLSREQLSHIPWEELEAVSLGRVTHDISGYLSRRAAEAAAEYIAIQSIELPSLIFSSQDLWHFLQVEDRANFVGSGRAAAPLCDLSHHPDPFQTDLAGKIILIQQADPGYDWLFLRGIAGLVTTYGGANSHMAIRAAEFGLPAAIGIGTVTYNRIRSARRLSLDCAARLLSVVQ